MLVFFLFLDLFVYVYLRISNPCVMSPDGAAANTYSCSFATNFRIHPVIPSETGRRFANPVILPVPPRKTGSRNVMREKRPCNKKQKEEQEREKQMNLNF